MWRLLYREYKPDTATRKVGLLERVMDDQPAPGMDFGDWFLRWLDLVGECEKARGRMIDDDIKVAVMLKRSPKELRDHLVLESPQLANVEFKFPVMRELIQHGVSDEESSFLRNRQWKLQRSVLLREIQM